MSFKITAIEKTRARLIASESTTDSPLLADMIKTAYETHGYEVVVKHEDGGRTREIDGSAIDLSLPVYDSLMGR